MQTSDIGIRNIYVLSPVRLESLCFSYQVFLPALKTVTFPLVFLVPLVGEHCPLFLDDVSDLLIHAYCRWRKNVLVGMVNWLGLFLYYMLPNHETIDPLLIQVWLSPAISTSESSVEWFDEHSYVGDVLAIRVEVHGFTRNFWDMISRPRWQSVAWVTWRCNFIKEINGNGDTIFVSDIRRKFSLFVP